VRRAARICRIECVACTHVYALTGMLTRRLGLVRNSAEISCVALSCILGQALPSMRFCGGLPRAVAGMSRSTSSGTVIALRLSSTQLIGVRSWPNGVL